MMLHQYDTRKQYDKNYYLYTHIHTHRPSIIQLYTVESCSRHRRSGPQYHIDEG